MKQTVWKKLWNYTGQYKGYLFFAFFCSILGNTLLIFAPLLTGNAVDQMIGEGNVNFTVLRKLILILLCLYLISSFFQWLMAMLVTKAANHTIQDLRMDAFYQLHKLPIKYFDQTAHGNIISRLTNDIDAISDGLFQGITQIMSSIVIILGCFLFMMTISPLITVIVIAITPLCFIIAVFIAKHSRKMFLLQSNKVGELNGYIEEMIENQKVVKAFGYEEQSIKRFKEWNAELYICGQKAQWYSSLTNPTTRFVNNLAYIVVILVGSFMALKGMLTVGKIASFITYSNQFAKPINEITAIMSQIQSAFASAERVFSVIEEEPETANAKEERELIDPRGEICFENVSFSYQKERPLIKCLNVKVKEGDMVAIVGPTGSGKTTIVNLLMRFYSVNSGHILLDKEDLYHYSRESVRRNIGMVLQESWLFRGTIVENIAYGKQGAKREEVIAAAKEAEAHNFIMRLENGYDMLIQEDGGNLSGGQKQLLMIARVMLNDPPILILDEATSSIDTRTELLVQKAFRKIMEGRTSFVIAHRLSTIQEADLILTLKDGDIIEQGTHEELLGKHGFYYELYQSQFHE